MRLTHMRHRPDRNPAVQRSPAAPWCAIVYSFLKYLDPDRFRVEPLGAPQLPTTRITARGTQTIHFCAQINMRDRVEQFLVLGEHRPYQIPLLVELHVLANIQWRRYVERCDWIIL